MADGGGRMRTRTAMLEISWLPRSLEGADASFWPANVCLLIFPGLRVSFAFGSAGSPCFLGASRFLGLRCIPVILDALHYSLAGKRTSIDSIARPVLAWGVAIAWLLAKTIYVSWRSGALASLRFAFASLRPFNNFGSIPVELNH